MIEEDIAPIPLDWQHAPDQEEALHHQVGGEGVHERVDQRVREELQDGEDPENHPVAEPGYRLEREFYQSIYSEEPNKSALPVQVSQRGQL